MQHSADAYQPRISPWGHTWRLLLTLAISATAWFNIAPPQWEDFRTLFWVELGVGALSFVLMFFRRRWPLTIALLLSAFGAVSALSAGPGTLAAVSLATRRRWLHVVLVGVVALVSAQAFVAIYPIQEDPYLVLLTINTSVIVAALAIGMYVGSRRELLWNLRERALRAETEQELRVAQARSQERALIAREMHDVLAHRISQVSMHAGALAYREDLSPEEVRTSAAIIQEKSHEALVDLRQVLGVLRDGAPGRGTDAPQPTFTDLPALIRDAEESGMRIRFDDEVTIGADVPDRAGRTVYRILQEGLTNARKHAPGEAVAVTVRGDPTHGIDVTMSNAATSTDGSGTPGSGLGLVGLAERAALAGGRLDHRRTDRGFTLTAWIPWAP